MDHSPIVVGVDASDAAPRAVELAQELGQALGAPCQLIHAVRTPWASGPSPDAAQAEALEAASVGAARFQIESLLKSLVPARTLGHLQVRVGRAAVELKEAADEVDSHLIVIGGKRHSTFGRWFGTSTGHGLARIADRPVLVAGPSTGPVRRILAAIDFSDAGRVALATAQRYATALKAELRVVSVIEPLPVTPGVTNAIDHDEYYQWSEAQLTAGLRPLILVPNTDLVIRIGHPVETLLRELTDWAADLVVLGSHGRNVVERALLGSVSESLLNQLPTSLLLVPPPGRVGARTPALAPQFAGAL